MKPTRLAAALLLASAAGPAAAADFSQAAVGTAGSEFLLLDTSARGIALGGAMSAVTDDAASLYWNPAGLTRVPRLSATLLYAQYVADINYSAAAYAQRVNDSSVLAVGGRYLDGGAITQTNVNGLNTGTFHPRSYVAEIGWGQMIYDLSDSEAEVAMGVAGRMIRTDLGLASANGYSADLGVLSRFDTAKLPYDVGFALQNMGSGQKFSRTRDTLPTRLRVGGALKPVAPLTLSLEAIAPINAAPYGAAGVEYALEVERGIKAAARAGVNGETYQSLGVLSMLSAGLGLTAGDLSFDYAFVPMGALGAATHRISVSFNLPATASRRYRDR